MRHAIIVAMPVLATVAVWLGCIGFARLRSAFARLHCVAFTAAAAGLPVIIAAFVADGFSDRALKIVLLLLIILLGGAALSHACGRAFAMHEMNPEDP